MHIDRKPPNLSHTLGHSPAPMLLSPDTSFRDVHTLKQHEAASIIAQISRIERRTFPTAEAFDFNMSFWKQKPNTRVIYGEHTTKLVAYAVYVRMKDTALLHKVCVEESNRGRGVGTQLMAYIECRLRKEGCRTVHLWVDEGRHAAHRLYSRCGYKELSTVENYYGNGRTGIKMVFDLDSILETAQ